MLRRNLKYYLGRYCSGDSSLGDVGARQGSCSGMCWALCWLQLKYPFLLTSVQVQEKWLAAVMIMKSPPPVLVDHELQPSLATDTARRRGPEKSDQFLC